MCVHEHLGIRSTVLHRNVLARPKPSSSTCNAGAMYMYPLFWARTFREEESRVPDWLSGLSVAIAFASMHCVLVVYLHMD